MLTYYKPLLQRRRERSARLQTNRNKKQSKKKFEAITEKSIAKLKPRKKSRQYSEIKRQANQGLEGIIE